MCVYMLEHDNLVLNKVHAHTLKHVRESGAAGGGVGAAAERSLIYTRRIVACASTKHRLFNIKICARAAH